MSTKLYDVRLQETNGDQEYNHDVLVKAKNMREADAKAHEIASEWYDSEDAEKDEDSEGYWHLDGQVFVKIMHVKRINKKDWMERQYDMAFV